MRITMVKKIKADGSPCAKCADVEARLESEGLKGRIDQIVIADERDPESEGMKLAARHDVKLAPFFVVEEEGAEPKIYTTYTRFLKDVLRAQVSDADESQEILRQTDLDYV